MSGTQRVSSEFVFCSSHKFSLLLELYSWGRIDRPEMFFWESREKESERTDADVGNKL